MIFLHWMEWIPWPIYSLSLVVLRFDFRSSPSVQRECSLRVDRWLALLSVSLGRGKLPWLVNFLHGLKLREMPCFKWFRLVSMLNLKKSFIFSSLFIGNSFMPCDCLPVASRNA